MQAKRVLKINTTAIVPEYGNKPALEAIGKVFELREFFEWRGLGSIDHPVFSSRANMPPMMPRKNL